MPLITTFVSRLCGGTPPAPERNEAPFKTARREEPFPAERSEDSLVRVSRAQGFKPLLSEVRPISTAPSTVSDTCGTDIDVSTMLSICSTMFCRNLSVAKEVADCDTVCCIATSAFSLTTRLVERHEERRRDENTSMMARASPLYSRNASNEGHAFAAKSLCPCIVALGNRALRRLSRESNASFCSGVRVSFGVLPSEAQPPM